MTMKMRKIIFPANTHAKTKDNVEALAWATTRRGSRVWQSSNVKGQIEQYLKDQGYESQQEWNTTLKWLESKGYAHAQYGDGHKRRLKFEFDKDVILSGYSPKRDESVIERENREVEENVYRPADKLDQIVWGNPPEKVADGSSNGQVPEKAKVAAEEKVAMPPLPENFVKPEHWDELQAMLMAWAKAEPEVYGEWAKTLIKWLRDRNVTLTELRPSNPHLA